MSEDGARGGAGAVIVSVPLGLLVAVLVLGALSQGHDAGNGTVSTGTIVVVEGALGGGSVLCFALGAVQGWRQVGGRPSSVPALVFPILGLGLAALWLLASAAAYGS